MLKFELPEQMVVIILQCLAKQPYEAVAPAIMELQRQIAAQRPQAETAAPSPPPVAKKSNAHGENHPNV